MNSSAFVPAKQSLVVAGVQRKALKLSDLAP
jgi:hypothetical protein